MKNGRMLREAGRVWPGVVLAILFALVIFVEVHAAEEPVEPGSGVVGVGCVAVPDPEIIDEPKLRAIEAAKMDAILKAAGQHVDRMVLSRETPALERALVKRRDAIVAEYKVVSDQRSNPDGTLKVSIEARIDQSALREALLTMLDGDRLIVITDESNLGKSLKRPILERDLIWMAKGKGYDIVDHRAPRDDVAKDLVESARSGDPEAVRKIGLYYLANTVVVGTAESVFSQRTQEIFSAHASGKVRVYRVSERPEAITTTGHRRKGFGSNKEKAGIDAIAVMSRELTEKASPGLPERHVRKVRLKVREIGCYVSIERLRQMIDEVQAVREVTTVATDLDRETAIFLVKTTASIDRLAREVSDLQKLVIKRVAESEIALEARKI